MVIKFVKISWCICVVPSRNELKVRQNLLDSDYEIYMVRLIVAAVNWHKSLQFAKNLTQHSYLVYLLRPRSRYCPNQKLGGQKIFKKLKPQPEEPTNVTQFLSRTTEIHKYVKINTVDQNAYNVCM